MKLQSPDAAVVAWLDQLEPSQVWLPGVVVFELRYGAAVHPDASQRRKLELELELAAQRKTKGRPVDLPDTLRRHRAGAPGPAGHAQQPPFQ